MTWQDLKVLKQNQTGMRRRDCDYWFQLQIPYLESIDWLAGRYEELLLPKSGRFRVNFVNHFGVLRCGW
ncbi:hypothetical protein HanIR_Chr12g0581391 [Helianthus annuus]|nr:hypothetical protein HanIR_Chr12g0581391 [Helianthus annuus]